MGLVSRWVKGFPRSRDSLGEGTSGGDIVWHARVEQLTGRTASIPRGCILDALYKVSKICERHYVLREVAVKLVSSLQEIRILLLELLN